MNEIIEVKKKKELSKLPNSIVKKALTQTNNDVKEARALLRKYYGIFLTNKVLKGKDKKTLTHHISSKQRNYETFYKEIFTHIQKTNTIIDLGAGANGFSIEELRKEAGNIAYVSIEAAGNIQENLEIYYQENNIPLAESITADVTDIKNLKEIIKKTKKPRTIFLLQVVDALERFEKDITKRMLKELLPLSEYIIISLPLKSIGGKTTFQITRKWLTEFLEKEFTILSDTTQGPERLIILSTKKPKNNMEQTNK